MRRSLALIPVLLLALGARASVADIAALLPSSDLVLLADVARAQKELVPILKKLDIGNVDAVAADIESFARLSGVDLARLGPAVIGLRFNGLSIGSGALLLEGINLDAKQVETAATGANWKVETVAGEGSLFRLSRTRPVAAQPAANAPAPAPKVDEIFVALLGSGRIAFGDQPSVRSVLAAALAPPAEGATNALARKTLEETRQTALVRFAGGLPADLKAMLEGQGDLFKQLAAVKVIFGTLDLTAAGDAAIEARLRTGSGPEAAELETSLKSLVTLAKSFLGGSQDPKMLAINQLIDQIKVATAASDVELSVTIPKALLDEWGK